MAATIWASTATSRSRAARPISGGYNLAGRSLEEVERDLIAANLDLCQGNRERCAKLLGIGERTLYRKLKEYALR